MSSLPQKREQPRLDRHPGSILERVHSLPSPLPGRLAHPSSDLRKGSGCSRCRGAAGKRPRRPRVLPGAPGTLLTAAARGCRSTQTPFGLGTVGHGGAHSSVAPTICSLAPQCAASRSARAGGGCYARNVRVSGSPSGSKRTTNNLSARRPPPLSASLRSPAQPPPSSREAALRLAAGLASALSPCHPGLGRPCGIPGPLLCVLAVGDVLTNSIQDRPTTARTRFSPVIPTGTEGRLPGISLSRSYGGYRRGLWRFGEGGRTAKQFTSAQL